VPSRFVLQVDGAGSYLIVTQPRVVIGPVSSSRQPDVALLAEATTSVAMVERVGRRLLPPRLRPDGGQRPGVFRQAARRR
jgi:hypothetical protein